MDQSKITPISFERTDKIRQKFVNPLDFGTEEKVLNNIFNIEI